MKVIYSPGKIDDTKAIFIFLAGSIEMGKARMWQDELIQKMEATFSGTCREIILLNPRRQDWDSSWIQEKENEQFHQQVSWELAGLEKADYIIYYLQADTMSPITLLELGLHARSKKALVVCEDDFYRKGNVDIVCERYGIEQFKTLDEVVIRLVELSMSTI